MGPAVFASALLSLAPLASQAAGDCDCARALDSLVRKIEADYVGFHLAVRGPRLEAWRDFERALRERAAAARGDDCVPLLQELVEWFQDGHLFVSEQGGARLAPETFDIPDEELDRLAGDVDGVREVEGIWYAKEGAEYAVVRDPSGRRDFVAVLLSDDVPGWKRGEVKAEFRADGRGGQQVVYRAEDHSIRHLRARVWRGLLLHMPPVTWGKRMPLTADQEGALDARDPRAPTVRVLDGGAVLVSLPSHSPEYAPALAGLVERHRNALARAELLILDLRGDEGGSSGTSRVLAPFYEGPLRTPVAAARGTPVVLSSPDNIDYYRAMLPQGWVPPGLVARMEARPGEVVPFADPAEPAAAPSVAPARSSARRVRVLVDGGVVSAGEAFALELLEHDNVTLYGQNTGGMIDYQNVTLVPLDCPGSGLFLGYPTLAASDRLPEGGLNAEGIAPHVRIESSVGDWVRFVLEHDGKH